MSCEAMPVVHSLIGFPLLLFSWDWAGYVSARNGVRSGWGMVIKPSAEIINFIQFR